MDALLLLGPTGVGKTPLGELIQARGLLGRRCSHFDFGARLRQAAADPDAFSELDADAHGIVRRVLREGTLLEDHEFPIAAVLLDRAIAGTAADWLVLNGLPRHIGQAAAVDALHRVRAVVALHATPEVVHERIRRDAGGDRGGRADDDEACVAARLARYEQRTRPLVQHYATRGALICEVEVGVATTAAELHERLDARLVEELDD